MTSTQSRLFAIIASVVVIGVAALLATVLAKSPGATFNDSAAVLAIVGFTAVGIERIIEGLWLFVGLNWGNWWPLSDVSKQLNTMVTNLDQTLEPFYKQVSATIDTVAASEKWGKDAIDSAKKEVTDFQTYLTQLKKLPPDNQRAQLIAGMAQQSVTYLQTKYPDIDATAQLATQVTGGVADFVSTFKDQPGRRLISLYIGILIGMIVAGVLSLNLLAVIVPPVIVHSNNQVIYNYPWYVTAFGVILAGVVMGLGSSPAHEIIQAIQQYKQNLKTQGATNTPSMIAANASSTSRNSPNLKASIEEAPKKPPVSLNIIPPQ